MCKNLYQLLLGGTLMSLLVALLAVCVIYSAHLDFVSITNPEFYTQPNSVYPQLYDCSMSAAVLSAFGFVLVIVIFVFVLLEKCAMVNIILMIVEAVVVLAVMISTGLYYDTTLHATTRELSIKNSSSHVDYVTELAQKLYDQAKTLSEATGTALTMPTFDKMIEPIKQGKITYNNLFKCPGTTADMPFCFHVTDGGITVAKDGSNTLQIGAPFYSLKGNEKIKIPLKYCWNDAGSKKCKKLDQENDYTTSTPFTTFQNDVTAYAYGSEKFDKALTYETSVPTGFVFLSKDEHDKLPEIPPRVDYHFGGYSYDNLMSWTITKEKYSNGKNEYICYSEPANLDDVDTLVDTPNSGKQPRCDRNPNEYRPYFPWSDYSNLGVTEKYYTQYQIQQSHDKIYEYNTDEAVLKFSHYSIGITVILVFLDAAMIAVIILAFITNKKAGKVANA